MSATTSDLEPRVAATEQIAKGMKETTDRTERSLMETADRIERSGRETTDRIEKSMKETTIRIEKRLDTIDTVSSPYSRTRGEIFVG